MSERDIAILRAAQSRPIRLYRRLSPLHRVGREYDSATLSLVRFIKNAQELGFTLNEIGELIELRGNRSRSDEDVRRLATRKIEEIDRRIRQMAQMRDELAALVERCGPAQCTDDCAIIDAFDEGNESCRSPKPISLERGHHVS